MFLVSYEFTSDVGMRLLLLNFIVHTTIGARRDLHTQKELYNI